MTKWWVDPQTKLPQQMEQFCGSGGRRTRFLFDAAKPVGALPLQWDARGLQWFGVEGLDWHLHKPPDR